MSGGTDRQGATSRHAEAADVHYLCKLGGVARAGFYRRLEAKAPARAETAMRDAMQQVALRHKH